MLQIILPNGLSYKLTLCAVHSVCFCFTESMTAGEARTGTTTSVPTLITSFFWSPAWCAVTGLCLLVACVGWLNVMQSRAHSSLCLSQCQQNFYSIFKKRRRKEIKNKKKSEISDRLEKTYPGIIKCNFSLLKNHWSTNHRNASNAAEAEQSWCWLATTAESVTCKVKWDN